MRLTLDPASRRLLGVMALSLLLHLILLFFNRFPLAALSREQGKQIFMQATLQPNLPPALQPRPPPPPAAAPAPEKPAAHPEPPAATRGKPRLTGKGWVSVPAPTSTPTPAPPPAPAAEPAPPDRPAAALLEPNAPEYPGVAIQRRLESCVLAAVYVSALGDVQSVRILHADVAGIFDQSVIDAQSTARYLPARRNGENQPSRVLSVASFVLDAGQTRRCALKYAAAAQQINALPLAADIPPTLVEATLHGKH